MILSKLLEELSNITDTEEFLKKLNWREQNLFQLIKDQALLVKELSYFWKQEQWYPAPGDSDSEDYRRKDRALRKTEQKIEMLIEEISALLKNTNVKLGDISEHQTIFDFILKYYPPRFAFRNDSFDLNADNEREILGEEEYENKYYFLKYFMEPGKQILYEKMFRETLTELESHPKSDFIIESVKLITDLQVIHKNDS